MRARRRLRLEDVRQQIDGMLILFDDVDYNRSLTNDERHRQYDELLDLQKLHKTFTGAYYFPSVKSLK